MEGPDSVSCQTHTAKRAVFVREFSPFMRSRWASYHRTVDSPISPNLACKRVFHDRLLSSPAGQNMNGTVKFKTEGFGDSRF
jgi:hypothetical protein